MVDWVVTWCRWDGEWVWVEFWGTKTRGKVRGASGEELGWKIWVWGYGRLGYVGALWTLLEWDASDCVRQLFLLFVWL